MKSLIYISAVLLCFYACKTDNNTAKTSGHELHSHDKSNVHADQLISAEQARSLLESASNKFKFIHVGKASEYAQSHIPGALNVWRPDYTFKQKSVAGLLAPFEQIQELFARLAVTDTTQLILYDSKGSVDALRLAWTMDCYGFQNYKIINGGMTQWQMLEYPLDNNPYSTNKSNYFMLDSIEQKEGLATWEDIMSAMNDPGSIIIDTREEYEFKGQPFISGDEILAYKNKAFERGKIPGSIHLNWSKLVDLNGDHRIKSLRDIHYDLQNKGISSDKNIIVYCQSGSRSAHTYFVLKKILNFPRVKNYDGSWIEWSYLHSQNPDKYPIEQLCSDKEFDSLNAQLKLELKKKHM